ncbi:helix-turn-helix transcriptional regulator [Bariatricus sp. SGI.154]|uniref:helix-turn-helix transcriptional regulator n=1 Tax=Bariatricus sp. SGI.154 TaxID=3420549 RepID=UPI003CFF0EB4
MLQDSKIVTVKKVLSQYETEYRIKDMQGQGLMDCVDVYPGVQVIYNHFQSFQTPEHGVYDANHIEINHCLRGKYESLFRQKYYAYLGEGDLSISKWSLERTDDGFPFGYYEGVEILIDVREARRNQIFAAFHIDLDELEKKLALNGDICIMRATSQIQHICLEMYEIDNGMKLDYLKIKVLELLLFLQHNDFEFIHNQRKYYPRNQIETMKALKNDLSMHLSENPDFDKLAEQYHINIHTLRKAFKEIYGMPIYQWFKEYRLEYSMKLLEETDLSIIDIANQIGYSNPSKYSAAFSKYMDMTPRQYRKSHIRME